MKGIIFTDWAGINLAPLAKICSEPLFPLGDIPVIDYLLKRLKLSGIDEVLIILNSRTEDLARHLGGGIGTGIRIDYLCQSLPLGRGGAIREAAEFLDNKPFLLVDSSVVIDFDLLSLIDFHMERGSSLTIGAKGETSSDIELLGNGRLMHIRPGDIGFRGCGIYVIDPVIINFTGGSGYLDIEDQLLPSLLNKEIPVYLYKIPGYFRDIALLDDFISVNMDILGGKVNGIYSPKGQRREIKDRVWVGNNVDIFPGVEFTGPVIIGDNVKINKDCRIIGPTVIGRDCRLMDEVLVRNSIVLAGSYLGMRSSVDSSLVGKDYFLENGDVYRKIAVKGHLTLGDANLMQPDLIDGYSVLDDSRISIKIRRFIYLTTKRAMDIIISFFTLLLGFPVFLIISSAIKIDSRGPIFFTQRRCTKGGRRFSMIKFRSMAEGSENLQNNLRHKNNADGPLFKMANDPRLTRVGRFLRSSSLDELPQFLNALKGDMSLVGPRPLVMEEMGYSPEWREARLRVKAGITGMWQISGRSDTLFHDWIKNDIYYVKNQSLWLDLKILLRTIKIVVTRLGAR